MTTQPLIIKLTEIMSEVERIPKNGFNTFNKYKYATESDVQDACRKEMAKRKIMMIPDVIDEKTRETKTRKGNIEFISTLTVEYTLIDGESGETLKFKTVGEGQDSGDKASYKAFTGAHKYALMKLFMIPTGDDPEQDKKNNVPQGNQRTNQQNQQSNFQENAGIVKERINNVAKKTGKRYEEIFDYLINKSNERLNRNDQELNEINISVMVALLKMLEAKSNKPAQQQPPQQQQGSMLDPITKQPTGEINWGNAR